jgi:hypothetical protein
MHPSLPLYLSGGEVHAGDRVRYKGNAANVVFVSDGDEGEFAPGYEDYHGHEAGIMICDDDEELTFLAEPTEELEFVRRKAN